VTGRIALESSQREDRHPAQTQTGRDFIPQPTAAARRAGLRRLAAAPEAAAPPFDVFESKLRVPELAAGTVSRTGVVNRLRAERSLRLATVVAPAGYRLSANEVPVAAYATPHASQFVGPRIGCRMFTPFGYGLDLAALCINP
jgi:hypothetical protein